jgi:hypothetical protein
MEPASWLYVEPLASQKQSTAKTHLQAEDLAIDYLPFRSFASNFAAAVPVKPASKFLASGRVGMMNQQRGKPIDGMKDLHHLNVRAVIDGQSIPGDNRENKELTPFHV